MAGRKSYKELLIQPYGFWLWVFSDWEVFLKAREKKTAEKLSRQNKPKGQSVLLSKDDQRLILVYAEDESTLAHELLHAVLMIFEEIRSDPREGSGEPAAYLMSYIWSSVVGERKFKV